MLALCAAPFLLDNPAVGQLFPADAIARARQLLASFKGGVGAYTDSRGNQLVREEVARFIEQRDGVPSNPDVRRGTALRYHTNLGLGVTGTSLHALCHASAARCVLPGFRCTLIMSASTCKCLSCPAAYTS